jgi:GTP cyclohydrolase II
MMGNSVNRITMSSSHTPLQFIAQTNLPTTHGLLKVRAYRNIETGHEPVAIVCGSIDTESVALRVHDACFTSEVFGSIKCDCKGQLDAAIEYIKEHNGIIIYLHQEGRGIGLANKVAAYALQESGLDTIDANRALHLPDDAREYDDAVAILKDLGVSSVQLLTNNPRKVEHLQTLGVNIDKRIPLEVHTSAEAHSYLASKRLRMGHILSPKS